MDRPYTNLTVRQAVTLQPVKPTETNSHISQIHLFRCEYTQLGIDMSEICPYGPKHSEIIGELPTTASAPLKFENKTDRVTCHVGQWSQSLAEGPDQTLQISNYSAF